MACDLCLRVLVLLLLAFGHLEKGGSTQYGGFASPRSQPNSWYAQPYSQLESDMFYWAQPLSQQHGASVAEDDANLGSGEQLVPPICPICPRCPEPLPCPLPGPCSPPYCKPGYHSCPCSPSCCKTSRRCRTWYHW